jgi:hypothetical protein
MMDFGFGSRILEMILDLGLDLESVEDLDFGFWRVRVLMRPECAM